MTDPLRVNPLPAYHINRDLIHPDDFVMTLKGAVASVNFILMKRVLPDNTQQFAACVRRIDVLATPNSSPADVRDELD